MSEFLPLGEWVDRGAKLLIENDAGSLQQFGAAIEGLTESDGLVGGWVFEFGEGVALGF